MYPNHFRTKDTGLTEGLSKKSQSMTLAAPANAPGMKNRKSAVEASRRLTRMAWTMSASRVTSTVRVTTQITRKAATCCTAGQNRKSPTAFT